MSELSTVNRYKSLLSKTHSTCLSYKVQYILCQAGVNSTASSKQCLTPTSFINFSFIDDNLPECDDDSYDYFVECAQILSNVFQASLEHMISLTPEEFSGYFGKWVQWTSDPRAIQHCFELLKNGGETRPYESILIATTVLERSLGDVYLLRGKVCPSMLKDLFATPELEDILGKPVIRLLRIIMGPAISLNIRNVTWHGFPSPGELSPRYGMFLLHLIASLGQLLENRIEIKRIKHRPLITFPQVGQLQFANKDINSLNHSTIRNIFHDSSFVLPQMLPFWNRILDAYTKQRYDECVMLLLPQLEHALRRVFAVANNCPERVLTAENNTLFTTFDEILAYTLQDGSLNKLREFVGDQYVTLLFDLLTYPEGPRVRDRISHGECELLLTKNEEDDQYDILLKQWHGLANHTLNIAIAFALLHKPTDKYDDLALDFGSVVTKTRSEFHPVSLMQKELEKTVHALSKLKKIEKAPVADIPLAVDWAQSYCDTTYYQTALTLTRKIITDCNMTIDTANLEEYLEPFSSISMLLDINQFDIPTLYRYSNHETCSTNTYLEREEEIIGLWRKIFGQISKISDQVVESCRLKYIQWQEKSLRSRQRKTYQRMLNIIPSLSVSLRFIILIGLCTMNKMELGQKYDNQQTSDEIKLLKFILQYCENACTYTSPDKNRWDELDATTTALYGRFSSA